MKTLQRSNDLLVEYQQEILQVCPFINPIMTKGLGSRVWDVDGNEYLDLMAGQFCLAFGHSYEPLNKIISEQLTRLTHTNTLTLSDAFFDALEQLRVILPSGLRKTILLSTGAEAVECALRYARACKKRPGIAAVNSGYHGLTLGAQGVSTGGIWAVPNVPNTIVLPSPDWHYPPDGYPAEDWIDFCLAESERLICKHRAELAALILEPFISVGGVILPPSRYYQGIAKICRENDVLLIMDECQTCLGRTGTWFGFEHHGIQPDILVMAKIAGAGLPVSAVVMSTECANQVEGQLIHFSSHQNDPLASGILSFVIKHIQAENLLNRITSTGRYILIELQALSKETDWIRQPRGLGLMIGFDLPFDSYTKARNPGAELSQELLERGIMIQAIRQGRTFRVLPSFNFFQSDADEFITKLRDSLKKL